MLPEEIDLVKHVKASGESWIRVSNFHCPSFVFRFCRVESKGFRFRVWGLGFRVQGLETEKWCC